jgi:hypothetical protein
VHGRVGGEGETAVRIAFAAAHVHAQCGKHGENSHKRRNLAVRRKLRTKGKNFFSLSLLTRIAKGFIGAGVADTAPLFVVAIRSRSLLFTECKGSFSSSELIS